MFNKQVSFNYDGGKYVGEVKDGEPNGQGTLTFPDGSKYVGEFKDGNYNGQGTLTLPSGDKYVGEWKDDELLNDSENTYGELIAKIKPLMNIIKSEEIKDLMKNIADLMKNIALIPVCFLLGTLFSGALLYSVLWAVDALNLVHPKIFLRLSIFGGVLLTIHGVLYFWDYWND